MDEPTVEHDQLFCQLPDVPTLDRKTMLQELIQQVDRKVMILDDDPTGTQTVHDIPVVTRWSVEHLERELCDPAPASYILTNSRSLTPDSAVALNLEIAANLRAARLRTGRDFCLVSRSDSTLRGHFPEEPIALEQGLQETFDAWVVCPFFAEGGRLTANDIHYVKEGNELVPAAQTPFAADPVFGYQNSNLRKWIIEKTAAHSLVDRIESLSLEELRNTDDESTQHKLASLTPGSALIVNAFELTDLESAVIALLKQEATGKRFLYRTAASFVAVRSGVEKRPLLSPDEMVLPGGKGNLIVVGSYVPKTTAQLEHLLANTDVVSFELDVNRVLDAAIRESVIFDLANHVSKSLSQEQTAVLFTSRKLVETSSEASLAIGKTVSTALVDVVRSMSIRPKRLVAKGGITSSDIATDGCEVERAVVVGQVLPGVPVWRCGPESRYPDLPLVIFPGNVGDVDALSRLVRMWQD